MNKREFKDKVYSELAKVTKSMANPHRLEIIELLAQGECSVEQIAEQTSLSVANASQHLQVLKTAQLSGDQPTGKFHLLSISQTAMCLKHGKLCGNLGIERIAND